MMNKTIIDIAEKLISVTDLSNGKAGKICTDIVADFMSCHQTALMSCL